MADTGEDYSSSSSGSTKELGIMYVPPEAALEAFVEAVEAAYEPTSETLSLFLEKIKCFREQKISAHELESSIHDLLVDNAKFLSRFSNELLPCLNPRPSEDDALHFMDSVERAFPDNQNRIELINFEVGQFGNGKLSLYKMTREMKILLKDKPEPLKAYLKLVPESEKWFEDEDGSGADEGGRIKIGSIVNTVIVVVLAVLVVVTIVICRHNPVLLFCLLLWFLFVF